jgi:hypothetical protein
VTAATTVVVRNGRFCKGWFKGSEVRLLQEGISRMPGSVELKRHLVEGESNRETGQGDVR